MTSAPDGHPELEPDATTVGGPSRKLIFTVVAMALFMTNIDITIVSTALRTIRQGLGVTINWAGWTLTIYSLGLVVALPVAGSISDKVGRRRVLLVACILFTVASVLCGLSTNIYELIVFRAIQALGAGAIQPAGAGIIADHFGQDRDRAIGMFGTVLAGGQVSGPVIGGVIISYLTWRWIFFVNLPIGVVIILMIIKYIPESEKRAGSSVDFKGLFLLASCILTSIFGIAVLGSGTTALDDPRFLIPELCAPLLLALFVRHTRRAADPFIPMRVIRARGFAVVNTLNFFWGVCGFGVIALTPLYAEQRYRLPVLDAGTLLTARAVGALAIGTVAVFALRRTGVRLPLVAGYLFVAIGSMVLAVGPRWGFGPYLWLSVGAGIAGLGNGTANPASRNAGLQLSPDDIPAMTGLRNMFNVTGSIFSVAIITAYLNRSHHPGIAQSHVLWISTALVMFVMIPLVFRVPEHKGRW